MHDFSLSIEGKKKTAFVGASWAGKTTLIKLIAWYLHPNVGKIIVDQQTLPTPDINENDSIKLQEYYMYIGYLTQEPSIFYGTIRENLIYGFCWNVSDDMIQQVLSKSQCQFVYDFDKALDTQIGEKWIKLSGWQRQRLAIAKIMLKNPQIILLDEPTSALDSISEQAVTQAFHELFKNRTVIIIAHRLQTVKEADDIIVLEKGTIVQRGTHQELARISGTYKTMLELQSGF